MSHELLNFLIAGIIGWISLNGLIMLIFSAVVWPKKTLMFLSAVIFIIYCLLRVENLIIPYAS